MRSDFRYSVRAIRRAPMIAAVAIAVTALGTGANIAVFSAINGILLRPLPYADADRLMSIEARHTTVADSVMPRVSYLDLVDLRARSRAFDRMAGWYASDIGFTGGAAPIHARAAFVTTGFLEVLGASPAVGEGLGTDVRSKRAVVSDAFWKRELGASPDTVGRSVTVNGTVYTLSGIMPPGFRFPVDAVASDAWLLMDTEQELPRQRGVRLLKGIGHLAPGVSRQAAEAELQQIMTALGQEYPATNTNVTARVVPLAESVFGNVQPVLLVLWGASGLVLIITCLTVSNLLIGREIVRSQEIAVRLALGATRARVARLLLTEHLLLIAVGVAAGLALSAAVWGLVVRFSPPDVPRLDEIGLDRTVLLFAMGLVFVVAAVSSLMPIVHAADRQASAHLTGERVGRKGYGGRRAQDVLVVGQLTVTLALLVGAGLLAKSFHTLTQVSLGFDPANVATLRVALPSTYKRLDIDAFSRQLKERVERIPGVRYASSVSALPLGFASFSTGFELEGDRRDRIGRMPRADLRSVQKGYFDALGIPILEGRDFDLRDGSSVPGSSAPPAAIVNAALIRTYFDGEPILGRRLWLRHAGASGLPHIIVGIVGDTRDISLREPMRPEIYVPFGQRPMREVALLIKSQMDASNMFAPARAAIGELKADVPVYEERSLNDYIRLQAAPQRFNTVLIGLFAVIALFLSLAGLYGVMAQFVANRRYEIAVRMAIGASPTEVLRSTLHRGAVLTGAGLILGLVTAFALTRLLTSMLYQVAPTDLQTFVAVVVLQGLVAILACCVPAWHASRLEPAKILRAVP